MSKRSVALSILLSIITLGIYMICWFVKLTDDMNAVAGIDDKRDGIESYLLTLVTFGIYGYYWAYKLGEKRDKLDRRSCDCSHSSTLYLMLHFLGLPIVTLAIAQDAVNQAIARSIISE